MSGGQQQRVAIARALVGDRRLILADEPTGALDTDTGEAVLRLLRARCDAGAAGVLVTHEARHAAWADRVVFLRDGVVVDESGADRVETLVESGHPLMPAEWPAGSRRCVSPDATRGARSGSRGRSILVLVMIALPVLAVSAADVVYLTSDVDSVESLGQRLGAGGRRGAGLHGESQRLPGRRPRAGRLRRLREADTPVSLETVRQVLGRDVPATERAEGGLDVDTERGAVSAMAPSWTPTRHWSMVSSA